MTSSPSTSSLTAKAVEPMASLSLLRGGAEFLEVEDVERRVRYRFSEQQSRFGSRLGDDLFEARLLVDECDVDAESLESCLEKIERSAVDAGAGEDVVACLAQGADSEEYSGHSRGSRYRSSAAFKSGELFLEGVLVRVTYPGVHEHVTVEIEQRRNVGSVVISVSRALDEGEDLRVSRLRCVACVYAVGIESSF